MVQQPFIGTICAPPGSGKHPAIILLGGSEGGNLMGKAAPMFAAHGYVAASVAYFKEPGLPQDLVDIPVETIGRALAAIAARPGVDASFFPLERIRGPVLCLSAADDQLWDSPAYCNMAMAYLHAHHHPYADRAIDYPDAGHTFLFAIHGPGSAVTSVPIGGGATMALGGTVDGDMHAAAQAWPTIWQFLAQALP